MAQSQASPLRLTLQEFYALPSKPNPKQLYRYIAQDASIAPVSGAANIVLSRDLRRNVAIAAEMAVAIAKQDPAKRVVYINAYASHGLLKEAFQAAFKKFGLPETDPLDNCCFLELKMDQWNKESLRFAMNGADAEGNMLEGGQEATIIINSFEYMTFNRNRRPRIVLELLQLQEEYDASVILFSHELREDLLAGMPSRGAIGFIATRAATIFHIADPFARIKRQPDVTRPHFEATDPDIPEEYRGKMPSDVEEGDPIKFFHELEMRVEQQKNMRSRERVASMERLFAAEGLPKHAQQAA